METRIRKRLGAEVLIDKHFSERSLCQSERSEESHSFLEQLLCVYDTYVC